MSRERELLKNCLSYFDGAWEVSLESELYKEIEAELAKPEPEPVAFMYHWPDGEFFGIYEKRHPMKEHGVETPLYTSTPRREPLSEEGRG